MEVAYHLTILDCAGKAMYYTQIIVSDILAQARFLMLCAVCELLSKLQTQKDINEMIMIIQQFDNVFATKSQEFITQVQQIRVKHLHELVEYEMHYVNSKVMHGCKCCSILNAGHYKHNKSTICLSEQCLQVAMESIKSLVPHSTHVFNLEDITCSIDCDATKPQHFILQVSEYVFARYKPPSIPLLLTTLEEKFQNYMERKTQHTITQL